MDGEAREDDRVCWASNVVNVTSVVSVLGLSGEYESVYVVER